MIELPAQQLEYIEWLVDPHRVGTHKAWAEAHGLNDSTLRVWKKNPIFKRHLQKRLDELNINPLRIQQVLDNLFEIASGKKGGTTGAEQNAAAKTLLQYAERLEPARKPIEDRKLKDLSDEDLARELEERLAQQRLRLVKNE